MTVHINKEDIEHEIIFNSLNLKVSDFEIREINKIQKIDCKNKFNNVFVPIEI